MAGWLVALVSITGIGVALWGLQRQVSRPQPVTRWTPAIGLVMAPVALAVNVVVLRQARPDLIGPAIGLFGVGAGIAWSRASRLERRGTYVVARRSTLHVACWAASFAVTQLLGAFATAGWVAGGLAAMCFSAGTTVGTDVDLLVRRHRLLATTPAQPPSLPH